MTCIAIGPGRLLDLLKPDPLLIDFDEIAEGLARRYRYGALAGVHITWSVAQHLMWGLDRVSDRAKPWWLLHDGHEHYLGDWPRPVLQALAALEGSQLSAPDAVTRLKAIVDAAVHFRAGLAWPPPPDVAEEVDAVDTLAIVTEVNVLMTAEMAKTFDLSDLPASAGKASIRKVWAMSGSPGIVLAALFREHLPALGAQA